MHGHKNVYRSYDTWKFAFLIYLFLFFGGRGEGGGGRGCSSLHLVLWYYIYIKQFLKDDVLLIFCHSCVTPILNLATCFYKESPHMMRHGLE